jgi:hypothetical protein
MSVTDRAHSRLRALIGRRRAARRLWSASRPAVPRVGSIIGGGTPEETGAAALFGRHVDEADLQAYIDDALDPVDRMQVEAFLADHGQIAGRVDAYRAQVVAINAAFRAGEAPLSPDLARLVGCYARAVARTSQIGGALGVVGLVAILCMISEAALGAAG